VTLKTDPDITLRGIILSGNPKDIESAKKTMQVLNKTALSTLSHPLIF
jgi:hypothetical protein